jgi:hypothetical protein
MAGIPPELDNRQRVVPSTADRAPFDSGCLALVIVLIGLLALVALVGTRMARQAPVVAQPAVIVDEETLLPSAGEPVATVVQIVAEGVGTPVAAAAVGVEAGVTAFDAALEATPAPVTVDAAAAAPAAAPTLPPINVVQDGGMVWSCPTGCTLVPICADGAPIKAYTRTDAAGVPARVYFTREHPGYGDLPVNTAAGDLWFCTEEEASTAGFVRGQ